MEIISEIEEIKSSEALKIIKKSKRIVVVVGAGISTSSGIPDFRGKSGVYNQLFNGKKISADMMNARFVNQNAENTKQFLMFMNFLWQETQKAKPTVAHHFLRKLDKKGVLSRVFTQNIDCLEEKVGLSVGVEKKSTVVPLHGLLKDVRCPICSFREEFEKASSFFSEGENFECNNCFDSRTARKLMGLRGNTTIGLMRPDVVLYDEIHPFGDMIGEIVGMEIDKNPDLLLIMGTSLKVDGCKKLVKDISKKIHSNDKMGNVIYINDSKVPEAEWSKHIDFHLMGNIDEIIGLISF